MIGTNAPARLILVVAGFVIWSSALVLLYGVNALGCEFGWVRLELGPLSLQRGVLVVIWGVHLGGLALLLAAVMRRWRAERGAGRSVRFLGITAVATTAASLFATVWIGLPVIGLAMCT